MVRKILLVGGTGLIGGHVAAQYPEDSDDHLISLGRRSIDGGMGHIKYNVAPTDQWADAIAKLQPEIVISCLGSTMKKAGSKEAFAAIDRDLVTTVAVAAKASGAKQFIAVSSTMADSGASSFYLKVKGQAEDAMREQGFERLDIIRPGLLRGERTNDWRLGESLAILASPVMDMLLQGKLRRYRSIAAKDVAAAIWKFTDRNTPGVFIHENDAIWAVDNS